MAIVSKILDQLDATVMATGQTYFENTSAALGPVITLMTALLLGLVGLNMVFGVYRMGMRDSWQLFWRIVLIYIFALSWENFQVLYDVLSEASGELAMSFFKVAQADLASPDAAMDNISVQMSDTVDGAARSVSSIMRGLVAGLLYIILAVLMAAYVLVVGFAKIMIAFLLGMAPLAMAATLFEKTKTLFEAWLTSFVGYLLYPIAAAGVVGAILSVAEQQFMEQDRVQNLSMMLGFLVVVITGIFALYSIPQAASNITGQFNLASMTPQALNMVASPTRMAGSGVASRVGMRASALKDGMLHDGKSARQAQMTTERDWRERGARFRQRMRDIETIRGINRPDTPHS
jgi:type IV secretion system protein VirB6